MVQQISQQQFQSSNKDKRINEEILAPKINVIDENGVNVWILPRHEALKKAEDKELDLVEVGERDGVVIAKIMDYSKHLFNQQKQIAKAKSKDHRSEVKTLRITYAIWEHDLEIRRKQAMKFAQLGHPLKMMMIFRWRENVYMEVGKEKMLRFIQSLEDVYKTDGKISALGKAIFVQLLPKK